MKQQLSKWWLLGPPFAIAVSIFTYYAMFPSFRGWVDARVPWMATHVGVHLPGQDEEARVERMRAAAAAKEKEVPEEPAPAIPAPPPKPTYLTADGTIDLPRLSANQEAWPKAVMLRKAKEFAAVVDGKAVGKVLVRKGTEVHLLKIEGGKLGLEYQGGGAWAEVNETDLGERLRNAEP